jgi:hypothetical protein
MNSALKTKRQYARLTMGFCALLLLALPFTASAKLYKWVDDQGNVHFSDKVPPEDAHRERSQLNERGIEVDRIDRAKTKEEVAREQEMERLRAEQQRIIEEQQAADLVLLRTFRSEDDIIMSRDGKLAAVDVLIQVEQSTLKRLKQDLAEMQSSAAAQERQQGSVAKRLQQDIERTRQQIEASYSSILSKERDKQRIREKSDGDLERFRTLKKLTAKQEVQEEAIDSSSLLENLVSCDDDAACVEVWKQAEAYVHKYAVTRLQLASDTVIMTAAPSRDNEYSLTVSRIRAKEGGGSEIFLDLQCRDTAKGFDLCQSEKIQAIRDGFRSAVSGGATP